MEGRGWGGETGYWENPNVQSLDCDGREGSVLCSAPPQVIPRLPSRFTGPCEACRRRSVNRRACGVRVPPFAAGRCKAPRPASPSSLPLGDWSDAPGKAFPGWINSQPRHSTSEFASSTPHQHHFLLNTLFGFKASHFRVPDFID